MAMNGDEWFRLTKVDAAQRQLDMASFLFLVSCEYVSIHALASSAYQVIEDINRHQGGNLMFKDGYGVLDQSSQEWRKWLNVPQNFVKHADKDPEGAIRFRPWVTVITLCEAASAFKRIAGFRPVVSVAAIIWIESKSSLERESHDFLDQSELRLLPAVRKRYRDSESERFYLDYAKAGFSLQGIL
jgi:hypothetical protein